MHVLLLQHDVTDTLMVARDILQLGQLQHKVEEVADQEWVNAIKVHCSSSPLGWQSP